jgi:F-type H+-transporting ATPase subunit b
VNFDATTFVLEVLNFLVLVWLLQRFFYRPVVAVIERRRADEASVITKAQALRDEAAALKTEYEARLARAAEDRERARAELDGEIAQERERRLAAVDVEMKAERERRGALEARERSERDAERERRAIGLAARFATRLLARAASPELEGKLVELAQADLAAIGPEQRATLRAALGDSGHGVKVQTAYPLGPGGRAALSAVLGDLTGHPLAPEFAEDPTLEAGVCITAGPWELKASLRDELEFFHATADHDH